MSGWIFVMVGLVVATVDFLVGLRFSRMSGEQLERLADGSVRSPDGIRRVGLVAMVAAPLFFLVFAALAFGLVPIDAIDPIRFN